MVKSTKFCLGPPLPPPPPPPPPAASASYASELLLCTEHCETPTPIRRISSTQHSRTLCTHRSSDCDTKVKQTPPVSGNKGDPRGGVASTSHALRSLVNRSLTIHCQGHFWCPVAGRALPNSPALLQGLHIVSKAFVIPGRAHAATIDTTS